jgi:hypothetical protein
MQNPIQPSKLFATPATMNDLEAYIMRLNGSERAAAMTAAMMAWNLASSIVDQEITAENTYYGA